MELKVLSFPFYSCSFPEGHLYEIVPSHTPGSGNAMVQAKYSPSKPVKEQTWNTLSLKIWTTNMMRTGNHPVQQTTFDPKLKTRENVRQSCAGQSPSVFSETNLPLVSLDMFHSATMPSAFQQLGLVHFFFVYHLAEHWLKSKKACKYTRGYVGNPIALGADTYMLRDKHVLQ